MYCHFLKNLEVRTFHLKRINAAKRRKITVICNGEKFKLMRYFLRFSSVAVCYPPAKTWSNQPIIYLQKTQWHFLPEWILKHHDHNGRNNDRHNNDGHTNDHPRYQSWHVDSTGIHTDLHRYALFSTSGSFFWWHRRSYSTCGTLGGCVDTPFLTCASFPIPTAADFPDPSILNIRQCLILQGPPPAGCTFTGSGSPFPALILTCPILCTVEGCMPSSVGSNTGWLDFAQNIFDTDLCNTHNYVICPCIDASSSLLHPISEQKILSVWRNIDGLVQNLNELVQWVWQIAVPKGFLLNRNWNRKLESLQQNWLCRKWSMTL